MTCKFISDCGIIRSPLSRNMFCELGRYFPEQCSNIYKGRVFKHIESFITHYTVPVDDNVKSLSSEIDFITSVPAFYSEQYLFR